MQVSFPIARGYPGSSIDSQEPLRLETKKMLAVEESVIRLQMQADRGSVSRSAHCLSRTEMSCRLPQDMMFISCGTVFADISREHVKL